MHRIKVGMLLFSFLQAQVFYWEMTLLEFQRRVGDSIQIEITSALNQSPTTPPDMEAVEVGTFRSGCAAGNRMKVYRFPVGEKKIRLEEGYHGDISWSWQPLAPLQLRGEKVWVFSLDSGACSNYRDRTRALVFYSKEYPGGVRMDYPNYSPSYFFFLEKLGLLFYFHLNEVGLLNLKNGEKIKAVRDWYDFLARQLEVVCEPGSGVRLAGEVKCFYAKDASNVVLLKVSASKADESCYYDRKKWPDRYILVEWEL
ncbi:MAG: hypothetical protein N3E49_06575 [Bacteroidia bacterium]|nr:hypothetical protein [Bacteroidia bacterium]